MSKYVHHNLIKSLLSKNKRSAAMKRTILIMMHPRQPHITQLRDSWSSMDYWILVSLHNLGDKHMPSQASDVTCACLLRFPMWHAHVTLETQVYTCLWPFFFILKGWYKGTQHIYITAFRVTTGFPSKIRLLMCQWWRKDIHCYNDQLYWLSEIPDDYWRETFAKRQS